MDSTDSSSCSKQPQLPPGFRFHPTDEELIIHYLKKKASSDPLPLKIITEIDLYKFDPWELPGKASFGDQEWYFFSPRDRKYPNGARPNRASTSGYWKATGTDKPILSSGGTQKVGVKKALVFYRGKPPKGIKTNWIMHEYRLIDNNSSKKPHGSNMANKKNSLRLDDWVLCRIYKKNNSHIPMEIDKEDSISDMLSPLPTTTIKGEQNLQEKKPKAINYGGPFENNNENPFEGLLTDPLNCTSVSPYWNDIRSDTPRSEKTMLQANHNSSNGDETNGNNSIANFLNQIPQTSPFHHQILHGSMGDGFFRYPYQIPDMNWNT